MADPRLGDGPSSASSWAAEALATAVRVAQRNLTGDGFGNAEIVETAVLSDESFAVVFRLPLRDRPNWLLGSIGERDPKATLRLMPHLDADDVPLPPHDYGVLFAHVAILEPYGAADYLHPDDRGIRWLTPSDDS